MSRFAIIPADVITDSRLTARDLRVLMAICLCADKEGDCNPSRGYLADLTGYPESRISTITTRLQALGWIVKSGKGGRSQSATYHINKTVTDLVTVTNLVTKTVTNLVTGIEQTIEQTNKEKDKKEKFAPPIPDPLDGFEDFWQTYPRKIAKANARKAWLKLKPDKPLQADILNAIEAQAASGKYVDPKYTPHPASWLNGERWLDDIEVINETRKPDHKLSIAEQADADLKRGLDRIAAQRAALEAVGEDDDALWPEMDQPERTRNGQQRPPDGNSENVVAFDPKHERCDREKGAGDYFGGRQRVAASAERFSDSSQGWAH